MSLSHLSSIKDVFSNDGAFCALKNDGTIKCWGHADFGGTTPVDISNVKTVFTSNQTFSALTNNNTFITWGKTEHGGGTTKNSKNIKKQQLLNRMYGSATVIHNVKRNNLRQKNNFNFNNSSYNRPIQPLLSKNDELFIENYSQSKLDKINKIKTLSDGKIKDTDLTDIDITNDKQRHLILDKIFSNVSDVSFNINSIKIGLSEKITKNNTKVFKSKQTINAKSEATSDIINNAVYGNLSDLSDNITVNMDNNVSFKVTRTTTIGITGKYNVEVLAGKMVVYGRYSGTIEFGTALLQLGEYQDGDKIIINSHAFFFGGFGCNNLTGITPATKKYQCLVTTYEAAAYLDSNGKVHCFGYNDYNTTGLGLDSGVVKLCATNYIFIALKDDGTVIFWGKDVGYFKKKSLYVTHYVDNVINYLCYDYSQQLTDIIDIFSVTDYKESVILRKKNNSFILIGSGLTHYTDTLLDENGNLPINGVLFENINQLYIHTGALYSNISNKHIIGINNKGKIVSIGEGVTYSTTTRLYSKTNTWGTSNRAGLNINNRYHGISGELVIATLSDGTQANYNGNFYQNYTASNMPPVSKIFINGSFVTAILDNGTAAWWGTTYVYGPRSGTYEKDNTNIITTSVFDQLRSRRFVDGVMSNRDTALLDTSGGVILFGLSQTEIFVDSTNELKNDISANIIKMVATKNDCFAFLRNDNTAILVPNSNIDISFNLFPNSYISSITQKGTSGKTKQTYLIPNIKDIFTGGFAGLGFITTSNNVIIYSFRQNGYLIDIGEIVGGKLENVKELFSNGNAWCALKHDNTLVCIKGGKESVNNKIGYSENMSLFGCDYNDVNFGINGIYSNGGNGKGGCVLNGDGKETTLKNVKNVFSTYEEPGTIYSETNNSATGGFIAILDNGNSEKIVYWGNSNISYKKYKTNILYSTVKDGGLSLLDISNNLINATSSDEIFGIHTDTSSTWGRSHIMKNNKYKYENEYNYHGNIVIKITVQNISGDNKFVLNGDSSGYVFKEGYSYIFDTSDSSNTNYKIAVSNSPDISQNENCVQYLIPGETNSFMRYYKSNKYTYIYCETNGFSMGSLYNPATPTEFTAIETAFGGATEKDIVSKYVNVPINKNLLDVSLNNITMDTSLKKSTILNSLFTTLPTNNLTINKDKLGYQKSNIGLNSPLIYGVNMKVINTTKELRGVSISGETVISGAVALNKLNFDESLYINMTDLSDNILLNIGDKIGAPYVSTTAQLPTFIRGIEFTVRRITNSSSDARYDISSNFGTLKINSTASNFNTTSNTGYYENNDAMEIEDVEIIFHTTGFITKGRKKIYTKLTVTVNSDSKFLFNGSTSKPIFEYDKNYKFDVSDTSNENYKLRFSSSNSTNVYNSIGYGKPGTTDSFVTFTPGNFTAQSVYVFDSSNNDLNIGSLYNPMPINNGISKTNLDAIEAETIEGSITLPGTLYSNLVGTDEEKENKKNLRRHQMLRTIFAANPTNKTLETTNTNLGFGSEYIKSNFNVFNPLNNTNNIDINVSSDTTNTKGFYSALEDNNSANITLSDGTILKVERTSTDSNNCGVYYVTNTTSNSNIFVTETNSKTYIIDSNPAGPFKDNDTATINYMPLVFGGVGDGRNTNPSLNPSAPTLTSVFNNAAKIPIIPGGLLGGFAGIASDGKLYKWGVSATSYLPPGDDDGNAPSDSRITDVSFCVAAGHNILFCKTDGSVGNTAASGLPLNNSNNFWYNSGTLSNDLTGIQDVVDIYTLNSSTAILLRSDGSIALWGDDGYSTQHVYRKNEYSLRGDYGKRLMDSTDANFSKIIKIVTGPYTVLLLRQDGKIAHLSFTTTDATRKKRIIWNGPAAHLRTDSLFFTLVNCLENDGDIKNYIGNVVDIGCFGMVVNDDGYYILNDKGQFMIVYLSNKFEGNFKSPHYSISYDTTSPYFKKTVKVLIFRECYLQITEDYSAILPGRLWTGGYNKPILNKTNPYELNGDDAANVNILNGKINNTTNGITMYNESLNGKRTIDKYYGQFILMNDCYLLPAVKFGPTYYSPYKESNWNDAVYGIYGTANGYPADKQPYGVDLSNVKMVSCGHRSYAALLNDGKVLTWGKGNQNTNKAANSYDVSNQLIDVSKVLINFNGAAAALKSDGSVVIWGNPTNGGSIIGDAAPATTPGMSNTTLNSGVLDIFCNDSTFTAVKSDGVIVWGLYKNSDYLDDLQGKSWAATNNVKMKYNYENTSWSEIDMFYSGFEDPDKTNGRLLYKTTADITSKANELVTAGVSQNDVNTVLEYPSYITNLDKVHISSTFFSSGTKDTIRQLLIELLFLMKPKINKFKHLPSSFVLDSKINKDNFTIFKANMGAIDLSTFNNYYDGYYSSMVDTNMVNFRSIDGKLFFQLKRSGDNYILEKQDGTSDISANNLGPFTSGKLEINDTLIKFSNGVYDGTDKPIQKFNCIANTWYGVAYLTKTGKVITWGKSDHAGYSHEEYGLQSSTPSYSISSNQDNVSTDAKSNVIDIVSTKQSFSALKADGSVVTWGHIYYAGKQNQNNPNIESLLTSNVIKIYSNLNAFCALKKDGTVVCWGSQTLGGDSTLNNSGGEQKDIVKVFPHLYGFIGLKSDKSIVTWGNVNSKIDHATYGVNGTNNNNTTALTKLTDVLEVYIATSEQTYSVIKTDGSIVRWGYNTSSSMPADLLNRFNKEGSYTNAVPFVNIYPSGVGVYPIDASGGVYVISNYSFAYTYWDNVKTDISANVTRVVANSAVVACLRSDNRLIVFGTHNTYYKRYGGDFDSTDTAVTNSAHLPPSEYIVNDYTLKNIKDVFPGKTGFAAIDISDNVICWGEKYSYYVNNIDYTKIYGGDLSGNDISQNRPVALFNNGRSWACLKEDETVITWDGTNTNNATRGSKHIDTTYGVNSTYWGGNNSGGAIRNGDGTNNTLSYVKNIVPYGQAETCGFIAICEDGSSNQFCVAWGSDDNASRWSSSTPNSAGRGFRHIVDKLTEHSKYQVGIFNNRGNDEVFRNTAHENLHEYDFGNQAFTGNETGFGSPVTKEEIYDLESIDSDASANGIPTETITKFKNSKLNEDVDETEVFAAETSIFQNSIDTTKTKKEIRKQRKNILKLAFANNPKRTKFKTTAASLGYTNLSKTNIMVIKINFGKAELNLKDEKNIDDNTGFLIPIEDGQEASITNKEGTSKFKITRDATSFADGDGKYYIEAVEQVSMITNFESSTYIRGTSPQGPFKDGDRAIIAGVPILFGGITEDGGNYSFGDPYINPIFGSVTKLPDKKAMYRLFQGLDVYINCSVDKISEKKQKFMEEWFYKKTGFDSKLFGFITSGYFYNKIYITSENHELFCDFDKQSMTMDEKDQEYFTIVNTYGVEKENTFILNEKCSIYTISWPHKEYNNIEFTVKIYENPQIDNAVSIQVAGNIIDCKGLLIRNYKPSLMRISDIKIKKDKKLNKRLKKAKNKFSTKAIKDENEVWVKVKGT